MKQFHFSFWPIHNVNNMWDTYVKDHFDMGLTVLVTPSYAEGDDPAKMIKILDECQEYGMKAIIFDKRVEADRKPEPLDEEAWKERFNQSLKDFGWHPAVIGYFVGDEPGMTTSAKFFRIARLIREIAPNMLAYLNLLPWLNFDWIPHLIGSPAYGPYLDRAIQEGNLAFVSNDCYTQLWDGGDVIDIGYNDYFYNLREMRDAAIRNGVPFHTIVLSCGLNEYRCPDQTDMRWQISTAAALGAKAISYFVVDSRDFGDLNFAGAPMNLYNERTPLFAGLSEETRKFRDKHGSLMMELTCQKSEFTMRSYGNLMMFTADDTLLKVGNDKNANVLVSTFVDADGNKYRAFVNLDLKKTIKLSFTCSKDIRVERKDFHDVWVKFPSDTNDNNYFTWMEPGAMCVLREIKE